MYVCMYVCMTVCMYVPVCMYVCMYVCMTVCMYVCRYVCVFCAYVHVYVCMCINMYNFSIISTCLGAVMDFPQQTGMKYKYTMSLYNEDLVYTTSYRIVLMPSQSPGTNFSKIISDATVVETISELFGNGGSFPLHSLLSDAASRRFSPPIFVVFETIQEKACVVVIVALFSSTVIFLVVAVSVCCEDKRMQMETKKMEIFHTKGPSLFTPIAEKETGSYSSFQQRKKRLSQEPRPDAILRSGNHQQEAGQRGGSKYTRLSSPVHVPSTGVTSTEISLADLSPS